MAIVYCDKLAEFEQWEGHPESPFRLKTLKKKLTCEGLWESVTAPFTITDEDVLRVHTNEHLKKLKKGGNVLIDADTLLKDGTYEYAMMSASVAATAVSLAADRIPSFALTRPPGHHAGRDFMGGFCYLNNTAVAVERSGLRTAIVDLDVHHGNGTEDIFYGRDDVLLIDVHQDGIYTGTGKAEDIGKDEGHRYTVNIPVPRGSGNKTYMKAMDEIIVPVLKEFRPELIAVSLGADAHYCETNADIVLNTQGYIDLCERLLKASRDRRIAFILEGGYHLRATAEVVAGIMAMLEDRTIHPEYNEERLENSNGPRSVGKVRKYLSGHWNI